MGSGEKLLLLHGVMGSARHWQEVAPLLAGEHEVIALTALGHRGGPVPVKRPVSIAAITDATERQMDELGIERAHFAGNSMGGWMAPLARRGRALSVCALSPAGMWDGGDGVAGTRAGLLRGSLRRGRLARPLLPFALRSPAVRRYGLRVVAVDGSRLSPEFALALTDDMLHCQVVEDLFSGREHFAPLHPAPCPVTLAWAEHDLIFPPPISGTVARERIPAARYLVLKNVGHVPMFDDPALVAATIAETVRAATATAVGPGVSA